MRSNIERASNTVLNTIVNRLPLLPEHLNLSDNPPITTVYDPRTRAYNPTVVDVIVKKASGYQVDPNTIDYFVDGNSRSTVKTVVDFKRRGVKNAVVVGFVTGPQKLDPDGYEFDTVPMAERSVWFKENLNSLLHPTPPWVKKVCLVLPDFEARSDRDASPGESAKAEVEADSILGAKRLPNYVITVDAHSHRLHLDLHRKGVRHIELTANKLFAEALVKNGFIEGDVVVAAPDIGATNRADDLSIKLARLLNKEEIELSIVDKLHNKKEVNQVTLEGFIREVDVKGKTVIIRDDRGDTLNTMLNAAQEYKKSGANKIFLINTHAIHSLDKKDKTASPEGTSARQKYEKAIADGIVDGMFITDSRPLTWEIDNPTVHIVPVGEFMGEIAASVLTNGMKETQRIYSDHILRPKHPYATLEEIAKRRNRIPKTVFARTKNESPPQPSSVL